MPERWSWWECWCFFSTRAQRMFLWCNGRFGHFDAAETLYLETVMQVCNGTPNDFLGLPLTIFTRHPCRLSLSKLRHHEPERSAWKNRQPVSLADRDPTLLNMAAETWASNSI